jgi:hypothetical protein
MFDNDYPRIICTSWPSKLPLPSVSMFDNDTPGIIQAKI